MSDLSFELFFYKNTMLYASVSGARIKDGSNTEKTSSGFNLGLTSDPNAIFSGGLEVDSWGLRDSLTVSTLRAPLSWQPNNWRLGLTPGTGIIRFPSITVLGRTRDYEIEFQSLTYQVGYFGFKNWSLKLGATHFEYSEDISRLSGPIISLFFSDSTIGLASGLLNRSFNLSGKYNFEKFDFGLTIAQSESAFDKQTYNQSSLDFEYYISHSWSWNSFIGSSQPSGKSASNLNTSGKTNFLGVGLTYNWF
jgi:hypothetical protein